MRVGEYAASVRLWLFDDYQQFITYNNITTGLRPGKLICHSCSCKSPVVGKSKRVSYGSFVTAVFKAGSVRLFGSYNTHSNHVQDWWCKLVPEATTCGTHSHWDVVSRRPSIASVFPSSGLLCPHSSHTQNLCNLVWLAVPHSPHVNFCIALAPHTWHVMPGKSHKQEID